MTSVLYLRYIYTVSKVGYIYIKSVIPVTCTTGNWLRWVTDPCRNPVAHKKKKSRLHVRFGRWQKDLMHQITWHMARGSFFMDVIKIILRSELRQNLHFLRARQTSYQWK